MRTDTVSSLRQRMIEDMNARKLGSHTQRSHILSGKRFAAFLKRSPHTCSVDHPDRHLMRPSPPIDNCSAPCHSRRLTAGSARARVGPPQSSALSRRILSCSVRPTRLLLHAPSLSRQKRSRRTLRSNLLKPRPAAKSP